MRLWSLSPSLLDRAALVACWREALLAQKVLAGLTKGYTKHPQLARFRAAPDPLAAIGYFLGELQREATERGYNFNEGLITCPSDTSPRIPVTAGQVVYEVQWLREKVRKREAGWLEVLDGIGEGVEETEVDGEERVEAMEGKAGVKAEEGMKGARGPGIASAAASTFVVVPGGIEEWEKVESGPGKAKATTNAKDKGRKPRARIAEKAEPLSTRSLGTRRSARLAGTR